MVKTGRFLFSNFVFQRKKLKRGEDMVSNIKNFSEMCSILKLNCVVTNVKNAVETLACGAGFC